jgi:hypothetical protein
MHRMPDSNRIPTVSRVSSDTLVELVYNAAKHTTALAVSRFDGLWNIEQEVSIGTGELLVPYSPANNLIASGCVLLPSEPVEYGLKDELIADIQAFLHRYVDLSPLFEQIASYYVLLSWVHDAFGELSYLRLRGDYGTGKTRALHTIGSLCYRPFFASGASTVSPIFHTLDSFGGTLVLDEADLPYSDAKADLVKILNNGTAKGMPVLRTIQNRYKEFNPYAFKVYGPKLIATRELFEDIALESRFFTEETYSRTLRPDIPVHLPASMKDEALTLRNRLLHFRFSEYFRIKTDPNALIEGVEPRTNQSAFALLSLVDDPALRADIQSWLKGKSTELACTRREAPDACILAAVIAIFAEHKDGPAPVAEITQRFNADNADRFGPMSYRGIGAVLRGRLNLETRKTGGVFVVPAPERAKLPTLALRYGLVAT